MAGLEGRSRSRPRSGSTRARAATVLHLRPGQHRRTGAGNGYLFATGNSLPDQHRDRQLDHRADGRARATTCRAAVDDPDVHAARATRRRSTSTASQVEHGDGHDRPGRHRQGVTTANYLGKSDYTADGPSRARCSEFAIYNRALTAGEVLASAGRTDALLDIVAAPTRQRSRSPRSSIRTRTRVVFRRSSPGTDLTALAPDVRHRCRRRRRRRRRERLVDLRSPVTVHARRRCDPRPGP